jgi:hypothetical protein
MRSRLAACSAYDSNRLSSDEVAGLLERVTGQEVLREQTRQHLVVAQAAAVSQPGQAERQADTAAPPSPAVTPQVAWYDPQREEGRRRTDAMQVQQHKARRGQGADNPALERATKRGHPEGWLGAQPPGGFPSLTAGGDATGQEVVAGPARGRWPCQPD